MSVEDDATASSSESPPSKQPAFRRHTLPDLEKKPSNGSSLTRAPDPYKFKAGLKNETELAELRRRPSGGKKLEKYQARQNDVRMSSFS